MQILKKKCGCKLDASFTHHPSCVRMDIEKEAVFIRMLEKS